MTAPTQSEIRRRPDGSIDIDHYIAIGRREHSNAIIEASRVVGRWADIERLIAKLQPAHSFKSEATDGN